ncbi:MAG: hypothetical protein KGS45_00885 [Planctomycetes bacterium]|nr:hypothetical protein [Planctomycetota bacterium]
MKAVASVPRIGGGADLYAGGNFDQTGTTPRSSICRWNGTSWDDLGGGLGGPRFPFSGYGPPIYCNFVTALDVVPRRGGGADLVVGGCFDSAGGMPVLRIARWDGNAWHPMGSGLGRRSEGIFAAPVALTHMPNMLAGWDVFAGGGFVTAGGNPAKRIARWDGAQWHHVDGGLDGEVADLLVVPGTNGRSELYAAGDFVQAGSVISCRIAIANCPTPMCKTDINGDMQVDFFDYVAFLSAFAEQADIADFNEDFTVDFFDYLDFAAGFSQGC